MAEQTGTSVFDMDKLTVTQDRFSPFALSKVPGIDKGAGQGYDITRKYFLVGCPGDDVKLIHGQRWQKITGDMHEEIDGDRIGKISGSETKEIDQNETRTVIGSSTCFFGGTQVVTNASAKLSTHVGAVLEQHTSPRTINQPTSWFQVVDSSLVVQLVNSSLIAEYVGASIGYHWVSGHMFSLGLIQTEAKMLDNGLYVFKASGTAARAVLDAAVCNIRPVTTELGPEFRLGPLLSAPPALPAN